MGILVENLFKCIVVYLLLACWVMVTFTHRTSNVEAAIRHRQSHYPKSGAGLTAFSTPSNASHLATLASVDFSNDFIRDAGIEHGEIEFNEAKPNSEVLHDFYKRPKAAVSSETKEPSKQHQQTTVQEEPTTVNSRSRAMPYGLSKGLLDIRKANEHYLKVHTQARCKVPKPRVVRVKEFYPDSTKEYLPSCTILHKCGDDTGCCDSETMQCVAKRQDVVELYFYKLHLSNVGGGVGISGADTVEKLAFLNDTECECQIIDDRPRFHVRKTVCLQCPTMFTLREQHQGVCACDCFDKQKSCLRIKRGREVLPETDRRCVETRKCHQPECEFGIYDSTTGRCPRKHERRSGHSGHQWWRFDERD